MVFTVRKIFAILAGIALISTAFVVYEHISPNYSSKPNAAFGPILNVNTSLNPLNPNSSISSTITLQVFSPVPSAFGVSGYKSFNLTNPTGVNSNRYLELINTTLSSNSSKLLLPGQFNTVAKQWREILSGYSGNSDPSLTVIAHKTVFNGTNVSVYTYYNNVPFNPDRISIENSTITNSSFVNNWFNGTQVNPVNYSYVKFANTSLNLSLVFPKKPTQIIKVKNSSTSALASANLAASPDTVCSNFYYNKTFYTTTDVNDSVNYTDTQDMHSTVMLPLLGLHFSNATSAGKTDIAFSSSIFITSDKIGFNSANAYQPVSGETTSTMSTNPSYSHTANVSTGSSIAQTVISTIHNSEALGSTPSAAVNGTTGVTGINNVTYEFVHYTQYSNKYTDEYEAIWSPTCEYFTLHLVKQTYNGRTVSGNGTYAMIVSVQSVNGIKIVALDVPIEVNSVIHDLLEGSSNGSLTLNYTGTDSSYQASTVWAKTYGYSNAASVIKTEADALDIFSSSIELGLAVSDTLAAANGADADTSEPAVIADSLSMIAETTSMVGDTLSLLSTISFISGTNVANIAYGFSGYTNPGIIGSNYTMQYYESQYPVSFTANGNTYSFYAPTDYLNATGIVNG